LLDWPEYRHLIEQRADLRAIVVEVSNELDVSRSTFVHLLADREADIAGADDQNAMTIGDWTDRSSICVAATTNYGEPPTTQRAR
jgi:hypothetical protein